MTFKRSDGAPAGFPVVADLEAVAVDILPGPKLALD